MPYKCRQAQRSYQRTWVRRRRSALLAGRHCVRCGSVERLEFHHVDPGEKVSHRISSWAPSRQQAELEKCVSLCRECHVQEGREAGHFTKHARLTPAAVATIRGANPTDDPMLARKFGVSRKAIRDARCGRTWRWVDPVPERT